MTDCLPNADGTRCIHCGWKKPAKIKGWPRRNCPKAPSRGLGDTVAKITTALGIPPCGGCKERQKLLNRLVPYRKKDGKEQ